MMRIALALALAAGVALTAACADPDVAATETVEAYGFRDVRLADAPFAGVMRCGQDDQWGREFEARGPGGSPIRGVVCGAFLGKGTTLRLLP